MEIVFDLIEHNLQTFERIMETSPKGSPEARLFYPEVVDIIDHLARFEGMMKYVDIREELLNRANKLMEIIIDKMKMESTTEV